MKELEEMKKAFDEFMAKAEQTLEKMKGKQEILDKEEKEYLENLLRPFRDGEVSIVKNKCNDIDAYIKIWIGIQNINLPLFKTDTMYKGMEPNKEYTLDELGLFKE